MAQQPKKSSYTSNSIDEPAMIKLLLDIQQKINASPALNGGFDTLLYKVDKIEGAQGEIVGRLSEIHSAIYNPDEGLFARIVEAKNTAVTENSELDKKLIAMNSWRENVDKLIDDDATKDEVLSKRVDEQQNIINDLKLWRANVSSLGKWMGVAFGGGFVTVMFKLIYDAVTTHWK